MKKLFSMLLMATLVIGLSACTNTDDEGKTCGDNEVLINDECVNKDLRSLKTMLEDFRLLDTLDKISNDMTLPTSFGNAEITWTTSDATVITDKGEITRTLDQDTTATLTATFKYKEQEVVKTYEVTVLANSAPEITIPDSGIVKMVKGDDTSLSGAVAKDANEGTITDQITITGTYDVNAAGFYDVTLEIVDEDGASSTKNATLQVTYAAPVVVTGETWGKDAADVESLLVMDVIENFETGAVYTVAYFDGLIANPTLFVNTGDAAKTITITNGYAVGAVINANGVVIKGYDGANGRIVDETCGVRTSCPQSSTVAGQPLTDVVLQPGEMLLMAPNNSTDYNEDGRKFINEQIINRLEKEVALTVEDELIYTAADQAPFFVISGSPRPTGSFTLQGTRDAAMTLLEGIKIYDYNSATGEYTEVVKTETFDPLKSVAIYNELGNEVTVDDYANFTFTESGVYAIEYTIQDEAGNERVVETQMTIIVFEELAAPAFRMTDESGIYLIDLMPTGYTFDFEDTNDIDTGKYHIYKDYATLVNDTTNNPHKMGWGAFVIFDEATGIIEVVGNWSNIYKAASVDYMGEDAIAGAECLGNIQDIPAGKVLLVAPQGTILRGKTGEAVLGMKIEFINVDEVASVMPSYSVATLVIDNNGTPEVIDVTGYNYNATIADTNNMPTGATYFVTDYNNILGLDGTPLNMGYGSYLVVDDATSTIEAYVNWANAFTIDGVDYVDFSAGGASNVLDTLTSLPAGKTLIVNPQGSVLRDTLHNTIGTNTDLSGAEIGIYNIYEVPTFKIQYNGQNVEIDLTGYVYDTKIADTNNMPTGAAYIVKTYDNILGLDGTPVNMGYGSYLVLDEATMTVEAYVNWANSFTIDSVDYVDFSAGSASNVLDTLTSLPTGKILIVCPQSTTMRDSLHNGDLIGTNSDISGLEVQLWRVDELID